MFSESDGYERFMGRWSRRLAPLFVTFAGVTEGDRVLDVGSGTGALAVTAAAIESVQVTGIERSPAYVRYAREHADGDGVRFEVGDALALPFSDDAFDRTLSMLVLNFVPDPAAALQQMIRVTRPGGVVAAAVWDYGDGMQMLRTFWDAAVALDPDAAPRDERHMPLCTARRTGGAMADARPAGRRRATADHRYGVRVVRRLLAAVPVRSGTGGCLRVVVVRIRAACVGIQTARASGRCGFALRARAWAVRGVVT